ncbi:MAG TPA: UvrD-helicase domain-containing protein [Acidimicrobiales bacterium]|nr:UvrD-helicase domain-containing protein [Acidimicrobiales bacterium]
MTGAPPPFDVCGPMPGPGITVLEASAGTGKTFTIAALATRLVADGTPLSEILAVTFTRMATGELRDRVRARMVGAEEALGRLVEAGEAPPAGDDVLALLATGDADEVRARRRRLAEALASFDSATITTTHGFCQLVLAGLGVCGAVAVGATLLEDPSDLVEEVVDDLFVRGWLRWRQLPFKRAEALRIARASMANPSTELVPEPGDDAAGLRRRFADGVRQQVERRLLAANRLTYDDLLVRLADTLEDPERGEAACARLRQRYRVVLVDEFQDTDPVQWKVVERAFGTGATTLVLIGDPKQAVYAFRGADVYAYLEAARMAARRFTLVSNWRSDEDLLRAFDALMGHAHLGHPDIPYRTVRAADVHRRPGLEGAPVAAPLRARIVHSADHRGLRMTAKQNTIVKPAAVDFVAEDLAGEVVRLLSSGAELVRWSAGGEEESRRALTCGDMAVLVRKNSQAAVVQRALRAAGVPAVLSGIDSVLDAPGAIHWLRLLEALEQPASRPRAVAVALTPFVGLSAEEVASADEALWESVHDRLHRWADVLRRQGVAALFHAVNAGEGLPARLLSGPDGERELTDLGHVAHLLHAEGSAAQLGPPALRAWLARRIGEGDEDGSDAEERSRRLDSDADAVQVLTVHRAKGLEFPVVFCPFLWDAWTPAAGGPVVFHDPADDDRRKLDVGGKDWPGYAGHHQAELNESRGEDLRHLYVALTRAKHQVVLWWARVKDCEDSPLGRLVMFAGADGTIPPRGRFVPPDNAVAARFEELGQYAPGRISVERAGGLALVRGGRDQRGGGGVERGEAEADLSPPEGDGGAAGLGQGGVALATAAFDRPLDLAWRRTSYTAITTAAHDEAVGSEPEDPGLLDEPAPPSPGPGTPAAAAPAAPSGPGAPSGAPAPATGRGSDAEARQRPLPLGETPAGPEVGTFVHRVLERVDFAATDLDAEVEAAVGSELRHGPADIGERLRLQAGLVAALRTPLGPLADHRSLAGLGRADRLDELAFELPLAGGDDPAGQILMGDLAALFARHTPAGSPLEGYAARLADPVLASHLRGYLNGSLDLVLRLPAGPGRPPRWLVADYKTNRLVDGGQPLTSWHYRPEAVAVEMQRAHYPLQALLYTVALHRYLRWRVGDYDPEVHLGGVLYLFLRGMAGPDTPVADGQPFGVFAWRPPAAMVVELSDLLHRGSVAA